MLIAAGDLHGLQATLFNLGHCKYLLGKTADASEAPWDALDTAAALIDLDCLLRRLLNIGRDSAQAEILAASIATKRGDVALAARHFREAESLCKSDYDVACFHRARSHLTWARAGYPARLSTGLRRRIEKDLDLAPRYFSLAGHAVPIVHRQRARVARGVAPEAATTRHRP